MKVWRPLWGFLEGLTCWPSQCSRCSTKTYGRPGLYVMMCLPRPGRADPAQASSWKDPTGGRTGATGGARRGNDDVALGELKLWGPWTKSRNEPMGDEDTRRCSNGVVGPRGHGWTWSGEAMTSEDVVDDDSLQGRAAFVAAGGSDDDCCDHGPTRRLRGDLESLMRPTARLLVVIVHD